jgi:hypothetical protein
MIFFTDDDMAEGNNHRGSSFGDFCCCEKGLTGRNRGWKSIIGRHGEDRWCTKHKTSQEGDAFGVCFS